jgi:hypothetical protein
MESRDGSAAVAEAVSLNVEQIQQGAFGQLELLAVALDDFFADV